MWNLWEMWDWGHVSAALEKIIPAIPITLTLTFVSFAFAIVFGLVLAMMRRAKSRWISWPAIAFIEFIRSTPLLVQAIFLYFVLPMNPIVSIVLPTFTIGILAIGIHYSTYMAEVYRSGIEAVDKGQWEAAQALNYTRFQTWVKIILPQAIPPIIPIMGNYLIIIFKETPILAAISIGEILAVAKGYGSEFFRYLEPITMVGIIFLIMSYPSSVIVRRLEKRLNRQRGFS